MRRYKIVTCILLIFSVFGPVLAAPAAIQEVREVYADTVDGGEDVIIGSEKRAKTPLSEEEPPLLESWAQEQAATAPSNWKTIPWPDHAPSSAPDYAGGTRPNPSFSSGGSKPPLLSTSAEIELPPNPEGKAELIQPGVPTEIQPASSSMSKLIQPGASTEIQPASSKMSKSVSFGPSTVIPPSGEIMAAQQSPSPMKPKSKSTFKKLVGKLKFKPWRRVSRTADGVVTEG